MKKPRIRRFSRHPVGDGSARVAFEITPPLRDGFLKPEILRQNQDCGFYRFCMDAFLPQDCVSTLLVAIIHVHPQDVIVIRFFNETGVIVHIDRFRISKSFIPELFQKNPKSGKEVTPQTDLTAGTGTLVHMHPDDLKKLFCDHHPKWLRSRLDSVLYSWEMEIPMFFLRVAPRARIARNLPLLIQHEPQRALLEFHKLLDVDQLRHCIQQEPFAAVQYAFEKIPRTVRIGLVRKYSTFVLEHHLDCLIEGELVVASCADAKTAFLLRHFVEGRRHAIMLANSYPASFFMKQHAREPEFLAELKDSVLEHPRTWRSSHQHSFATLFRALSSTLSIAFSGEELLALSQKLGPGLRAELQKYIVSRI